MKFKFVAILLALCTAAGSTALPAYAASDQTAPLETSVSAGEHTWKNYEYKVLDDGNVEITGYTGQEANVSIPQSIDSRTVTSIGPSAFQKCTSLKEVTVPDGITVIGDYAFAYCSGLTRVTLPDSLKTLKEAAFGECSSLESITIPDGVTAIPEYAFYRCTSLAELTLPQSLTYLGENSFSGCKSLTQVVLPDSVKNIDWSAFADCTSLKKVTFPKNLEIVSDNAFQGCKSLESASLTEGLRQIGQGAFAGCESLKSLVLPVSTKEIAKNAFSGCSSLAAVDYAGTKENRKSIQIIGEGNTPLLASTIRYGNGTLESFAPKKGARFTSAGCTYQVKTDVHTVAFVKTTSKAAKLVVPSYVTVDGICYDVASVTKDAFRNNRSVTKITVKGDITSIGKNAFRGCSKLNKIVLYTDCLESVGANAFQGIRSNAVIKVPSTKTAEYKKLMKNKGLSSKAKIAVI